ncbi:hypothetical protein ABFS83_09G097200 [Erythranthe nasuta]
MEFSYTKSSRSSAPTSFANVIKQQKVGLLILNDGETQSDVAAAKVNVVFNARNITNYVVQTNPLLSSSNNLDISVEIGGAAKSPLAVIAGVGGQIETPGTGYSFTRLCFVGKPCLLSSNYIISQRMGTNNNNSNNPVPLTTCAKHGTAGFLPLDYARMLPEYTCTTHVLPVHRVVHRFEDCVLEFPESIIRSNKVVTKCSRCDKELSDRDDIYMSSDECRSEECTSCWSCDTIRNDDSDDDDELSDISSMGGPVVFTIDFFS